jgi:mRNA interferase RelE/StbE
MNCTVELMPREEKDLKNLPVEHIRRIIDKLEIFADDFQGDVKKLTDFTPEYRLRVGNFRVLFEVEKDRIIVYRILHRRESYR